VSRVGLLGQELARMRTRDDLEARPRGEHTVAGSDPRRPKGFGAILAPSMGTLPATKRFFLAFALIVMSMELFLGFQALVQHWKWNSERNIWWNEHFRG
jgi:hypothetical protein